MAKNKLRKFSELKKYTHVHEPDLKNLEKGFDLKGKWSQVVFKNNAPIVLELGCGKGEYSLALAQENKNKNFIGIDIKGARIYDGARRSFDQKINNVAFLRTRIEWIEKCFEVDEVDELWITFPDPHLKTRRAKKRLTHPVFLQRYYKILKKGGLIHLKTDSAFLHGFTLGVLIAEGHSLKDSTHNLYNSILIESKPYLKTQTYYEKMFLSKGFSITYLSFKLNY